MNKVLLSGSLALALVMGCRGAPPPVSPTPDPQIDSMIEQQAISASPGAESVAETLFRGVAYDRGQSQTFHVELTTGNCYVFVGAADEGVQGLQITVWDPENGRVAGEKSKSREALAQVCAKTTGSYKFEGKVLRGAGHFAIGVYGKEAPEPVAAEEGPKEEKLDLEKLIADEAKAVAPAAKQSGNFYTGTSEKSDFYVELAKGNCYWFIGAGQKDVEDYYIYLWDPSNKRIGETKASGNKAQFGHCAKESGMFHVQIKVDDVKDEVKMGIYSKKQ